MKRRYSPKDDELVRQDARLCATLEQEGYVYAPQDEKSEEWLHTVECRQSMEDSRGPCAAYVLELNEDNPGYLQDNFMELDMIEDSSDDDDQDLALGGLPRPVNKEFG